MKELTWVRRPARARTRVGRSFRKRCTTRICVNITVNVGICINIRATRGSKWSRLRGGSSHACWYDRGVCIDFRVFYICLFFGSRGGTVGPGGRRSGKEGMTICMRLSAFFVHPTRDFPGCKRIFGELQTVVLTGCTHDFCELFYLMYPIVKGSVPTLYFQQLPWSPIRQNLYH